MTRKRASLALLLAVFLHVAPADAQTELFFEDFEDATVGYTPSVADDLSDIASGDYFGRIDANTAPLLADAEYTNLQGQGFYAAQDTNSATNPADSIDLDITGINISNFENLAFSFFVAEDDSTNGDEDWDTLSSLQIEFQIDGGGFMDLFAIEAEIGTDGNATNEVPRVDTDFDGTGDGAEITPAFTRFTESIAGSGSTLDLRISIIDLDSADEDIAFDNLLVTGELVGGSPPGDYNNDGAVNAADYTVFRDTFGQAAAGLPADGDGSGSIGLGDFDFWAENFTGASVAVAAVAVPEPTGVLLGLLAATALLGFRPTAKG